MSGPREQRPLLTLDFDGVICRPLFGQNVGIHREFIDARAAPKPAKVWPHWLNAPLDYLRFDFRSPMPGVREALARLSETRRLVVVTGRRTVPHGWIRRHGLEGLFDDVVINRGARRSPHFKLEALQALRSTEHVEDDPRTAQLLAEAAAVRVYLHDWPRNRGLDFHPLVERVANLGALAERIGGAGTGHS